MNIDVALVPSQARRWSPRVCVMVDELRSSSTLTTALDLGCSELYVTRSLADARRLARDRDALLAGERGGRRPQGFDFNNSPTELLRAGVRGKALVLSTANGTAVLEELRWMPAVLIGCLRNATACSEAALGLARAHEVGIGVVCAGVLGRFALDDAVTAGVIVERLLAAMSASGETAHLEDGALAVLALARAYPDPVEALEASETGHLCHEIGAAEDIAFCGGLDMTESVAQLCTGATLSLVRLGSEALARRPFRPAAAEPSVL